MAITEFTTGGLTVRDGKIKRFQELMTNGKSASKAAAESGLSLSELRKQGILARSSRDLLQRVNEEGLLNKTVETNLARARRIELMMQDDDLAVAARMTASALEKDTVGAVINNNFAYLTPEVRASIESLGLPLPESEEKKDATH